MIRKIFHISDIHVRNFKRHQEYRRVFESLYSYLKNNVTEDDLICLTGDIVHAKTDITPELIEEVQNLFKALADIGTVLVIPGNHDTNLNNNHRLDALTPIVNALNHNNLVYLKRSTTHIHKGVIFSHWSVFDTKESYITANMIDENYFKIALYHGPVNSALSDSQFTLFENEVEVEDFDGFDLVLLGDIHKTQYLNESKTIGYPGSLIQQNHAEGLVHGIYVWDLESKSSEFIEIKNDTGFYTIEVDAGNYNKLPDNLPKNLYLRVKYKNTDQSEIKRIVSNIKQDYNIIETSLLRIKDFGSSSDSSKKLNVNDIRDIEYQNTILADFIKEKFDLGEKAIKNICELNKTINNSLPKSEIPRNSIWVPKTFEFNNMFSYGENNYIDFSNMNGTYGIFAPNASGKSTLLDSIAYCIFDKCSRTSKAAQVMNSTSDSFNCKLVFELNGLEYTIERTGFKQKYGNTKVNVDFYYYDEEGNKISLNGKERNDTNNNIRNVVGNYEDFVLTALSMQNNNTGFIDMNQKDRKDLLAQFLDINIFEDLYNIANNEVKEISILLKEYQKEDYHELLKNNQIDIKDLNSKLKEAKQVKQLIETTRNNLNNQIIEETKNLNKIELLEDISDLEAQKKKIEDAKNQLLTASSEAKFKLVNLENSKLELTNKLVELDIESIEIGLANLQKITKEYTSKLVIHSALTVKVGSMEDKLSKLKDLNYDPNCSFCMNNIFVKDAIEIKEDFPKEQKKLEDLTIEISNLKQECINLNSYNVKNNEYKKIKDDIQKLINESSKYTLESSKLDSKIKQSDSLIELVNSKINKYTDQQQDIEKNKDINDKIKVIKLDLDKNTQELNEINDTISELLVNKKLAENNKIKYEALIKKIQVLESKYNDYQYYLQAVHRDGIPHKLIANTIPQVEEEINNILAQLVEFSVILQADDKNINAYIAYDEDNYWPLELTSGMEKFIASLAIRTSLINVSTLPRPNFMAIDEGFGALDQSNLGSMAMLFDYLKTQFRFIMIISHIDSMRDIVDHHIEVNKIDGKSKIEQTA
jgi:DNA repair exonuclease SbcCD ATPase subunit/UDP-2,3-diacylglucosamine pyrophosphatase LpxH